MATQAVSVETEWVPSFGFGDRLRVVRRKKHRSQDEMAELLGVKKVTYSSWEAGRSTPSLEEVQQLSRRLYLLDRVPQWWTLGADEPPASVWGAPSARSSTDRASDYGSEGGSFSPFQLPARRRADRRRQMGVIPLRLLVTDREVASA